MKKKKYIAKLNETGIELVEPTTIIEWNYLNNHWNSLTSKGSELWKKIELMFSSEWFWQQKLLEYPEKYMRAIVMEECAQW